MDDGPFVTHRNLLFTVAYEILGSAADADDVVQEAWLRWAEVDHEQVRDARAYAVRIVTRQALNRVRTMARRRENYVGPWLPEPVLTSPDVAEEVELAESVSLALLTVLQTLQPTERAVFVLREVFAFDYTEIADAVGRTPSAVRQLAYRARQHVAARRPRNRVDPVEQREVLERFAAAVSAGQIQELMEVLAPDVVLITDGGGRAKAALHPLHGAGKVARFLLGVARQTSELSATTVWVNGMPGLRVEQAGELDSIVSAHVAAGALAGIYLVRNPGKLTHVGHITPLSR